MHIEPGLVSGTRIMLGHATAVAVLSTTGLLAIQTARRHGLLALPGRSLLAVLLMFCCFEALPHKTRRGFRAASDRRPLFVPAVRPGRCGHRTGWRPADSGHSTDLPLLARRPWLRDLTIITLSLPGLIFCLTGCPLGWQRLMAR